MSKLWLGLLWTSLVFANGGTSYHHDMVGRLSLAIYPNGKVIQYHYDATGNMLSRRVSQLCYDYQALRGQYGDWEVTKDVTDFVAIISCITTIPKSKKAKPGAKGLP